MRCVAVLSIILLAACATQQPDVTGSAPAATAQDANRAFDKLAEDYYDEVLALNPIVASSIGDNRYNDRYTVGFSEDQRAASLALAQKYTAALRTIDANAL